MDKFDKNAFEQQIRIEIAEEQKAKQRAYKAEWRNKNREHIRQYNKLYRIRKKLYEGGYENE